MHLSLSLLAVVAGASLCLAFIPANYERVPGQGVYRYSSQKKTWDEAKADCEREGATLAVLNSQGEATAIKELFNNKRGSNDGIVAHIGFEDREAEGVYKTVHGGTLDSAGYNVWKFPPTGSSTNQLNDCGGMIICGRLTEMPCNKPATFFCEFPTVPAE